MLLIIAILSLLLGPALTASAYNHGTRRDYPPQPSGSLLRPSPGTYPTARPYPPSGGTSGPPPPPSGGPRGSLPRQCRYRSYTALGDSYSAGLNYANNLLLPSCAAGSSAPCNGGDVCLRNADAFPYLLQSVHNFPSFNFLACSGANTTDCDANQVHSPAFGYPDLVTITIGGDNNQAFLGLIVNCVYQRDAAGQYCQYAIANAQQTVAGLDAYLRTLFRDIMSTNPVPRRRVAVVGYPKLWSSTNANSCQAPVLANVPIADRQAMNDLADGVNGVLRRVAAEMGWGFVFVDTDGAFEGKRLCDAVNVPLFQYDFATALYGVFHPTEEGQKVLATSVDRAIGCA